jgi:hypothetical protein
VASSRAWWCQADQPASANPKQITAGQQVGTYGGIEHHRVARHAVDHGQEHLSARRSALEGVKHRADVGGVDQRLVGQQHHHGMHVAVQRA